MRLRRNVVLWVVVVVLGLGAFTLVGQTELFFEYDLRFVIDPPEPPPDDGATRIATGPPQDRFEVFCSGIRAEIPLPSELLHFEFGHPDMICLAQRQPGGVLIQCDDDAAEPACVNVVVP